MAPIWPLMVVLVFGLVTQVSLARTTVSSTRNELTAASFLEDLLQRYGENETLSLPQLQSLLERLEVGKGIGDSGNLSQCLSASTLFAAHNLTSDSTLDAGGLQNFCPSILQQLETRSCQGSPVPQNETIDEGRPSSGEVWGFGFVAVTVISLFSLLGVFFAPCVERPVFRRMLTYFIALSIGTLLSNALLQLIPEVQYQLTPQKALMPL